MSTALDIAVGFGKFLAAATPELAKLWASAGHDTAAALSLLKKALYAARAKTDDDLKKKHGK